MNKTSISISIKYYATVKNNITQVNLQKRCDSAIHAIKAVYQHLLAHCLLPATEKSNLIHKKMWYLLKNSQDLKNGQPYANWLIWTKLWLLQVNFVPIPGNTNSPKLSLLKFYYHSHFLATTCISQFFHTSHFAQGCTFFTAWLFLSR